MFMNLIATSKHLWIAAQSHKIYAALSDVPTMI